MFNPAYVTELFKDYDFKSEDKYNELVNNWLDYEK